MAGRVRSEQWQRDFARAEAGHLPHELPIFLLSVAGGAVIGTWLGVERLPRPWLLRTLGLVLTIAGAKLLFT